MAEYNDKWTFLTNHAMVLSLIAERPDITARTMADEIGITERAVRKIIADLDADNYITKTKEGRGVRYALHKDLPLRRKKFRDIAVGTLLGTLKSPPEEQL